MKNSNVVSIILLEMKNSNVVSIILLVIAIVAAAFIIGSDGINKKVTLYSSAPESEDRTFLNNLEKSLVRIPDMKELMGLALTYEIGLGSPGEISIQCKLYKDVVDISDEIRQAASDAAYVMGIKDYAANSEVISSHFVKANSMQVGMDIAHHACMDVINKTKLKSGIIPVTVDSRNVVCNGYAKGVADAFMRSRGQ